jgi:hypothetical protein
VFKDVQNGRRTVLGMVAIGFAAIGALLWWGESEVPGGVMLRTAAVFGAIWLAYPAMVRLTWRGAAIGAMAVVAAVARPALVLLVVPLLLLMRRR